MVRAARTVVLLCCLAVPLGAQEPEPAAAAPFLPQDHWSIAAIERLHAVGLVPAGYDRGSQSHTRAEVRQALDEALLRARERSPGMESLVDTFVERFRAEYPPAPRDAGLAWTGATVTGEYAHHEGAVRTGRNLDYHTLLGPTPRDPGAATLTGAVSGALAPYLALSMEAGLLGGEVGVRSLHANAEVGPVGVWAGRRAVGWRTGRSGGLVLDGRTPFDGAGVYLARPLTLPSVLRYLGPIRFETFLSRLERNGEFEYPMFWGARGSIAPHPRVGLGVTRGAMFGGEGNYQVTPEDIFNLIIGRHGSGGSRFENQIAALDVWYRPPVLPVLLYLEWGFEDSAGAWRDVPGILAGVEMGAVPGMPALSLALDYSHFSPRCCGNPYWYRHWWFLGGWTNDGLPMGHPLGGHGDEWRATAHVDPLPGDARLTVAGFHRTRGEENLFAPDRAGRSIGSSVQLLYRPHPSFELSLGTAVEAGAEDWTEWRVSLGARSFIH